MFDVESARADGAPPVHDVGNTLVTWQIHCGDVAGALAAADVVVEGEYRSQHVEHAYLEPEAGVGWLENGVLTLRVSTQVIEHAATDRRTSWACRRARSGSSPRTWAAASAARRT